MFCNPTEDFNLLPYNLSGNQIDKQPFADFIDREEEYILRRILGHSFYDAFIDGLTAEEEKWESLRDGDSYTYGEKEYLWGGVVDMLRPFIYYRWIFENNTSNTVVGRVKQDAENSKIVSAWGTLSRAWNDFAEKSGSGEKHKDSLYGFIKAGDYPEMDFQSVGFKNSLDF